MSRVSALEARMTKLSMPVKVRCTWLPHADETLYTPYFAVDGIPMDHGVGIAWIEGRELAWAIECKDLPAEAKANWYLVEVLFDIRQPGGADAEALQECRDNVYPEDYLEPSDHPDDQHNNGAVSRWVAQELKRKLRTLRESGAPKQGEIHDVE